jgi:rubrerythrin
VKILGDFPKKFRCLWGLGYPSPATVILEKKMEESEEKESHAEWRDIDSPEQYGYVCSACGYRSWNRDETCPNCGRKMIYKGN